MGLGLGRPGAAGVNRQVGIPCGLRQLPQMQFLERQGPVEKRRGLVWLELQAAFHEIEPAQQLQAVVFGLCAGQRACAQIAPDGGVPGSRSAAL